MMKLNVTFKGATFDVSRVLAVRYDHDARTRVIFDSGNVMLEFYSDHVEELSRLINEACKGVSACPWDSCPLKG